MRFVGGGPAGGGMRFVGGGPAGGGMRLAGGGPAGGGMRFAGGGPAGGGIRFGGGGPVGGGILGGGMLGGGMIPPGSPPASAMSMRWIAEAAAAPGGTGGGLASRAAQSLFVVGAYDVAATGCVGGASMSRSSRLGGGAVGAF